MRKKVLVGLFFVFLVGLVTVFLSESVNAAYCYDSDSSQAGGALPSTGKTAGYLRICPSGNPTCTNAQAGYSTDDCIDSANVEELFCSSFSEPLTGRQTLNCLTVWGRLAKCKTQSVSLPGQGTAMSAYCAVCGYNSEDCCPIGFPGTGSDGCVGTLACSSGTCVTECAVPGADWNSCTLSGGGTGTCYQGTCHECLSNPDCDDGDICTNDVCSGNVCSNTDRPVGYDCGGGDVCNIDGDRVECNVDGDCNTGDVCNSYQCETGSSGTCTPGATDGSCGTNTGYCIAGTKTCNAGGTGWDCVGERTGRSESSRCANSIDDDCDGDTDCEDSSCDSSPDCGGTCTPTETSESTCTGGNDEDCDGNTDCADNDCAANAACVAPECNNDLECGAWELCNSGSCESCGADEDQCCTTGAECQGEPDYACNAGVCGGVGCTIGEDDLKWLWDGDEVSSIVAGTEIELNINTVSDCADVEVVEWEILDEDDNTKLDVLDEIFNPSLNDDGEASYNWEAEIGENYVFRVVLDGETPVRSLPLNVSEACYETDSGTFITQCSDYNDYTDGDRDHEEACLQDCAGVGVAQGGRCRWDGDECFFSTYGNNGQNEGYYCRHDFTDISACSDDQPYRIITTNSTKWNETTNAAISDGSTDCVGSCDSAVCNIESPCPRVVQLPFFTVWNVAGVVVLIVIVYVLWSLSKGKRNVSRRKK